MLLRTATARLLRSTPGSSTTTLHTVLRRNASSRKITDKPLKEFLLDLPKQGAELQRRGELSLGRWLLGRHPTLLEDGGGLSGAEAEALRQSKTEAEKREAALEASLSESTAIQLAGKVALRQAKAQLTTSQGALAAAEASKTSEVETATAKLKSLETSLSEATARAAEAEAAAATATAEAEAAAKAAAAASSEPALPDDPVFGRLLETFGSKRVFATEVEQLVDASRLPVWQKQRLLRPERASAMAKQKIREMKNKTMGADEVPFPGVISAIERTDGSREIVDGQHRVAAMRLLLADGHIAPTQRFLVEVHAAETEATAEALFTEINKAEPVRLVDLPGKAEDEEKRILEAGAQEMAAYYPDMFKPSSRCRAPHVNVDVLRDECFKAGALDRYGLGTGADFAAFLHRCNDEAARKPIEYWLALRGRRGEEATIKAWEKAQTHGFYLGLGWDWLHRGLEQHSAADEDDEHDVAA